MRRVISESMTAEERLIELMRALAREAARADHAAALSKDASRSVTLERQGQLQNIDDDTPLMLSVAAGIAFPDGSVSASSLRRERDKGKLVVSRIAGKDYTTLSDIKAMLAAARYEVSAERLAKAERVERGARAAAGFREQRNAPQSDEEARAALRRLQLLCQTKSTRGESNKPRINRD